MKSQILEQPRIEEILLYRNICNTDEPIGTPEDLERVKERIASISGVNIKAVKAGDFYAVTSPHGIDMLIQQISPIPKGIYLERCRVSE